MKERWTNLWQAICQNKKFRCGGISAALTAAAVVLVLVLGALADGIEDRYALKADFSFNGAATRSAVTDAVLSALNKDVHIYAVVPADGGDATLLSLLEKYGAASAHVTWSRESLVRNPVLQNQFTDAAGDRTVTDDCLIVHCPATGRSRVLNENDYYVYSYNTDTGTFNEAYFTYEKSLTEAILYVSQDELPAIQLLSGHGELTETDTAALEATLVSANYAVKRVNLAAGDAMDPDSPLMILSPRYDISQEELDQLLSFAQAGGDFFIATQYADPANLENFNALLRSYGIEIYPGLVIAKESDTASYYADSPVFLMPYMQETDATSSLIAAGKDILLLAGARAFKLPNALPEGVMLSPVLMTGQAYIRNFEDGLSLSDQQPGDEEGTFAVALWSDRMQEDGTVSRMLAVGNMSMFLDYWVQNSTDANAFLLQMLRSLQGRSPVNLDIVPKTALREGMTLGSLTPAVVVTVALPLLVLLGALLVLMPRKNL
ncbi:MAG: Gldg family protein [Clostridia bacterium]|nr:Gldg family protein [Clostridia bacterium]